MNQRRDDLSTADLASQQPTDTARPDTEEADLQHPDVTADELAREDLIRDRAEGVEPDVEPGRKHLPRGEERPQVAATDQGSEAVRQAGADVADGDTTPSTSSAGPLLASNDAEAFRARWTDVQNGFVDAPRQAVEQADGLVAELMQHLARTFADERDTLERQWDRGDEVSTDNLRTAFQRYRLFFERLLTT